MTLSEAIRARRSIRAYTGTPVLFEYIEAIIEAGRWAPTATNKQAARFIYIDDPDTIAKFCKLGTAHFVDKCRQMILVLYDNRIDNLEYNDDVLSSGAVIQNMLLKATELGIGACWVANLPPKLKLRKLLGIPKCYSPVSLVTLGYPDKEAKDISRKGGLVIHHNKFDASLDIPAKMSGSKHLVRRFVRYIYIYICQKLNLLCKLLKSSRRGSRTESEQGKTVYIDKSFGRSDNRCCCLYIEQVVRRNLCCLCCTCVGVCPTEAISYADEKISVDHEKCIACGKCAKCCPGDDHRAESADIGKYIAIYKGYSPSYRDIGASGGAATGILVGLLERGEIDGAVVVGNSGVTIARTKAVIIGAAQSKYVFTPVNAILRELRSDEKYALVGLPCQIQALRRVRPDILAIGLFCGFNLSRKATDFLVRKAGITGKVEYRAKLDGETGFRVTAEDGRSWFTDKHSYTLLNMFYTRHRCLKCRDFAAELADISVGDAWENAGMSRIITRTERGVAALSGLVLENSGLDNILKTQGHLVKFKKRKGLAYCIMRITNTALGRLIINVLPFSLIKAVSRTLRVLMAGGGKDA
ncbi:MAG: nitroreductase family protein [Clostridiales bacterium]|jgi:coenzyme F420 hydrogenase subunit beta|nr:nitroreductase family protein [Clostridiales bacterium]